MRLTSVFPVFVSSVLLAMAGMPAAAQGPAAAGSGASGPTDEGYGARSLRGLTTLHVEVAGEPAPAEPAAAEGSTDDPIKLLEGLLGSSKKSDKKKAKAAGLAADARAALQSRTSIKLHDGSLDAARAAGTPYLLITIADGPADANSNVPFEASIELLQQVALARDPKLTFYARTYDDSVAESAGGRSRKEVVVALMNRFAEFWRAAN